MQKRGETVFWLQTQVTLGQRSDPCAPLAGWRGARGWRRSNLWQMRRSAAVLAFVLMVAPPFQPRAPDHPQGFWPAEPGSTGFLAP